MFLFFLLGAFFCKEFLFKKLKKHQANFPFSIMHFFLTYYFDKINWNEQIYQKSKTEINKKNPNLAHDQLQLSRFAGSVLLNLRNNDFLEIWGVNIFKSLSQIINFVWNKLWMLINLGFRSSGFFGNFFWVNNYDIFSSKEIKQGQFCQILLQHDFLQ